ncbi:hypothetical protein [Shewanella algae]|uniref:hypothetical protein n=1 Tax=Shewanella algae TaxID=38313 RepID=UPI001687247C|nr:hypothetical protein [Shewanella algae]MBO2631622.1 hypothetical protein [Shewanella algae]QNV04335.1 hypothetical protein EIY89_03850 [Shewanella algae]
MINQNIRLIYSADCKKKSKQQTASQVVLNEQLGLFDTFDSVKFIFISMADISPHSFNNAIIKNEPYILIDTREFPDFFSVSISTEHALNNFKKYGIHYYRLPNLDSFDNTKPSWNQWINLKNIVTNHVLHKTNSPIIVLSSTKFSLTKISRKMIGYVEQEITNVTYEELDN